MKTKQEQTIKRATLLKIFSEKNLSQNCLLEISQAIKNSKDKELMAEKITTLMDKSEEEIIQALKTM